MKNCGCQECQTKVCAHKVPIFSTLSDEELIKIVEMTGNKEYEKGDLIFLEGSSLQTLYIINKGQIKLFKYTKDGKEQILHILEEGDFFGELSLFEEEKVSFNAEAMAPVKICTLQKEDLEKLLKNHPDIAIKILQVVVHRLIRVESMMQKMATNDVEARIVELILELKDKHGIVKKNYVEIQLPLTREDMANYIGVTRETISRKLSKFQQEDLIQIVGNRRIQILDEEGLRDYLGYE
ncbi:MAG: Crp/Fnr family transcriptional regulator [Epulopiscium sp.]|nr:Crp/Fnr family transcriptional regulator [Candidatus Epulonipiscium sp.]